MAQEARSEETGTTAAWVLEELKKVYEASMERNDKGVCANPAAANRARDSGHHRVQPQPSAPGPMWSVRSYQRAANSMSSPASPTHVATKRPS